MITDIVAPFDELIERCSEAIETVDFAAASAWKAQVPGRAIIGCFPVYSPTELFHAAGALPVGLTGGGNRLEITHADSRFQSFICSIIKSTLELGITGVLNDFDGVVFHSICDPARNLASVFTRNFEKQKIEYIHFPQRLDSPDAIDYLEREYRRILDWAHEITGHAATDEDLRNSIALYNGVRSAMRRLYDIRRERPYALTTRELYILVRYGHIVPPEEHLALLTNVIDQLQDRPGTPKDRARILIIGSFCEQPPLDLIASIEDAGCYIIDDDFLLGRRFFSNDIELSDTPLCDLAKAYVQQSVDASTKHDLKGSKAQRLAQRAREYGVDAVVVLTAKFCEPALFDYVLYRRALQEANIPHIFLEFEEKAWLFDKIKTEIETFVESLLFG